ncbi:MAG: HYR domain-containing protein, partial [Saprospirales bacterium]
MRSRRFTRVFVMMAFLIAVSFHGQNLSSANAALSISCFQNVQISLSGNGESTILPEMILSGSHPDYSIFTVSIIDPPIGGDVVDCSLLGETISVMVTNNITNNSCWGQVLIEDKSDPVIECSDKVLPCYESVDFDDPDVLLDTLYDNCTETPDIDLWYSQVINGLSCDPNYSAYLVRTWTATDDSGNSSTCEQSIYFERGHVSDIEFPQDTVVDCPQADLSPTVFGYPTIDGNAIGGFCELAVEYSDEIVPLCGNSFKLKRTWQAIEWCMVEFETHEQIIEVIDTVPPVVTCPGTQTVFTGTQVCEGTHIFPFISVEDACSDTQDIDINFRVEGVLIQDPMVVLPVGEHTVEVEAVDPCFNSATCEYTVIVEDNVSPVLVCHNIVVPLNNNGDQVTIGVDNIVGDFTITDNCGIEKVEIRRMTDECGNPDDLDFGETVTVCCEDVSSGAMVEVQATDVHGNTNSCMFDIEVQDKAPPVITFCPPDTTINCDDEMDDLTIYGQAEAEDNCEVIFSEFSVSELDECFEGTIFRTIIASDAGGNADSCVQEITVVNPFEIGPDDVNWPEDLEITECKPDLSPEALNSFPEVMVPHCPIAVGIYFEDVVIGADEPCLIIERTWEVFDSCKNEVTETHLQTILVKNNAPPALTGPSDTTFLATEDNCSFFIELKPVESDDCSTDLEIENDYNDQGAVIEDDFEVGVTTVTYTATDACGNTSQWTVIITVIDDVPPTVECPQDLTVGSDEGECGAEVTWDEPVAEDNCPGVQLSSTHDPGDFFGVGTTTVTYTATDAAGNTAECIFDVTVEDVEDPVILNCPTNIIEENDPGECDAVVEWNEPVAEDNCPGVELSSTHIPGDIFEVGTTTVTYTAIDAAGNTSECSFEVTVEDTQTPIIVNCPQDIIEENEEGECGSIVNWNEPGVIDNCPGVELSSTHEPGDFFEVGTTTVTYTATDDAGNTITCSFEVTVVDAEPPVIIDCPEDIAVNNDEDDCGAIVEWTEPSVEDNCPGVELVGSDSSGTFFEVGEHVVTYIATDSSGNTAECEFTVEVEDSEPPQLVCPDDIEVNAQSGECDVLISIDLPEVSDNCGVDTFFNNFNLTEDATDTYGVGITTVKYFATDIHGNEDSCSFDVIVIKDFDLEIECPDSIVVNTDPDTCGAFVQVPDPDIINFCDIDTVYNDYNQTEDASDFYPVGITVVVFFAEDADGSEASCEFEVTVEDNEAPEIICPESVSVNNDPDSCSADVSIDLAIAMDNCEVDSIVNNYNFTEDASDVYEVGVTEVVFTAFDAAGNSATCSIEVTVTDVEDPVIICPDDITAENDEGECEAFVEVPLPEASDNCEVDLVTNDYNNGPDASDVYPVGTTLVQFTAEDGSGNTGICNFSITVEDTEPPVIDMLMDVSATVDTGECEVFVMIDIPLVTDNCLLDTFFNSYTGTEDASGVYPLGETVVVYTAIDSAGNVTTDSFVVEVTGGVPLSAECPDDIIASTDPDSCNAFVEVPLPDGIGGCGVDSIFNDITGAGAANTVYEVGTTVVIYTVVDVEGNTATCEFEVVVEDNEAPEIICPESVSVNNDPDSCSADVSIDLAIAMDNCEVDSIVNNYNFTEDASDVYEVGVTEVVFTAFDAAGNSATCSIEVTVTDVEDPVIICPDDITAENDEGECEAFVEVPLPEASDNCEVDLVTNDYNNGPDASDVYPVGTTLVQFTAEDGSGNTGICNFSITVEDTEPPVIDMLMDVSATVDTGECEVFVMIDIPLVTDNCLLDTFFNSYTGTEDASGVYPLGETVVVYTAIDSAGNVTTDSFV